MSKVDASGIFSKSVEKRTIFSHLVPFPCEFLKLIIVILKTIFSILA